MNQIDRYQILGELGQGGMGTVYRAIDPRFGREVALKVLPSHVLHDPMLRQRFEREAKMIASLEHSAIVPVHDFGEYNGQPFLVMRLMSGGSLTERLKNGPLPLTEVARITRHLAPALDQAHAQGIIHRDLKPSNILFDQHNMPYITDFGIAKQTQATRNLTLTGTIMGTPEYMSPEQARGELNLSGHSDIYALGAILFEMLTGHIPYQADTPMGTALRHVTDPVPRLQDYQAAANLPNGSQAIIDRAMAKLPQARYPTAAALSADLMALVHAQPRYQPYPPVQPAPRPRPPAASAPTQIVSPPPQGSQPNTLRLSNPSPQKPSPWRGKWAKIAGMVGIVGLVTCICLAIFAWSVARERQEAQVAMQATQTEEAKPSATPSPTPTTRPSATPRATPTAKPSATSAPTPRPTPNRPATATAEAGLVTMGELLQDAEGVHGPTDGTLEHDESRITTQRADVDLSNFAVSARFDNPYDSTERSWDYGFIFRDVTNSKQYYSLIVDSDEEWTLFLTDSEGDLRLVEGSLENLRLSADQSNLLELLVSGTTGYFYVNQNYVTTLDLSDSITSGEVRVAAGFYEGNKVEGESTKFEEFKVWALGQAGSEETSSELLFSDDFSDTSGGWTLHSDEDVTLAIEDSQYHITVIRDNLMIRGHPDQNFSDFTLEVETTQVEGPDDNLYGVILRYVDSDNFYSFGISGDGYYRFAKWEDDEQSDLIRWTESSTIKTGQASNVIKVVCEGDTFTFFVNGERLDSHTDSSFASGDIGLFVGKFEEEGDVHINFDNLNVWAIE